MHYRILYIILLLGAFTPVIAQPVFNITAAKNTILTGEPDTVVLTASWPGHPLPQGFTVPDSFPHFEVWEKGSPVSTADGVSQTIVLTGYDSGRFSLPPFPLTDEPTYATDSFPLNIQPVNVDSLSDYHDIKDIIEVPATPQWPYILLIAALTVGSLIGLYFLLKKKGRRIVKDTAMPQPGAYQRAMEALNKLGKEAGSPGPAKPFFVQLTGIYRTYLSEAYHWRSHQQTGGELILQAKPLLAEAHFYRLTNAIRLGDAVKFAKYEPQAADWLPALETFRQTIETLEKRLAETQPVERVGVATKK